ncbi:MAG: helix-turn-helix domain-containing protein [Clostridia bacterium]|nr:helix-turn-helix domain-containing protein [Clostridia bacterium]
MTNAQRIKMALAYKNMSEAQLARALDTTPSAFNQRLKKDKLTSEELEKIASILGAEYKAAFVFPDGTQIG